MHWKGIIKFAQILLPARPDIRSASQFPQSHQRVLHQSIPVSRVRWKSSVEGKMLLFDWRYREWFFRFEKILDNKPERLSCAWVDRKPSVRGKILFWCIKSLWLSWAVKLKNIRNESEVLYEGRKTAECSGEYCEDFQNAWLFCWNLGGRLFSFKYPSISHQRKLEVTLEGS